MMLPTSYDYSTGLATDTLQRMSMSPSGREVDGELGYGRSWMDGKAWFGGNLFYRSRPGPYRQLARRSRRRGAAQPRLLGFRSGEEAGG